MVTHSPGRQRQACLRAKHPSVVCFNGKKQQLTLHAAGQRLTSFQEESLAREIWKVDALILSAAAVSNNFPRVGKKSKGHNSQKINGV